jgi:putative hemolysin
MELFVLLFLFILNGTLAMSEMAVVSARKARLQQWADDGRPGARTALALANEPSHFLSTIQVGITVIGITSGVFGEATIAKGLAGWLAQWDTIAPFADALARAVVVLGITFASLIIGELVPKRLALVSPEAIASAMARPMRALAAVGYPLVRLLAAATEGIVRLLGMKASTEPPVTEEEINVLLKQGAEAGVFDEHEQLIVARLFRLDQLKVNRIMTTRTDIVFLDLEDPRALNVKRITESSHSRFPVVRGGLENIEGVVLTRLLLEDALAGKPVELASRLMKPLYVPETLSVMQLVESFKKHRQPFALVVNEYGELQGLVTMTDVLEALVGDIATVEEEPDRDMVRREDGSWLVDGGVSIERFKHVVGLSEPFPDEDTGSYHTLSGFAMTQLGRVPQVCDRFEYAGYTFEVMDMDRNRVDKLLVKPPIPGSSSSEGSEARSS